MIKTTTQIQKVQMNGSYACHIFGLNGHKMTICPRFAKMQKMFQGKFASTSNKKMMANVKIIITQVNVVDVNVDIRNNITKEQVFQDREPRKNKSTIDWEEDNFFKTMVDTI